jgi:hypothetical protein
MRGKGTEVLVRGTMPYAAALFFSPGCYGPEWFQVEVEVEVDR